MIREVCLFDKFSFCKNGVRCTRIHLKEVCQNKECDYRKCRKRHPKPCRMFRLNGFCRFGTKCSYSHKLPWEMEDQNKSIESLEKITAKLSNQVEDQDVKIRELERQLLECESRELIRLQTQIDELVQNNEEKGKALAKLEEDFYQIKVKHCIVEKVVEEKEKMEIEEAEEANKIVTELLVESENKCKAEIIKLATISYAQKCLSQVEELEAEITNIRKNAKDLGTTLTKKCNYFCEKLDGIEVKEELCEDVLERVRELRVFLSFSERKPDKERNLRSIISCKKYLKGYLKYPKRPFQIPQNNCCKQCLLNL